MSITGYAIEGMWLVRFRTSSSCEIFFDHQGASDRCITMRGDRCLNLSQPARRTGPSLEVRR